jgi:hypothetical protein
MNAREAIEQSSYFGLNENWGNVDMVDPNLVIQASNWRHELGKPVIISPVGGVYANGTGHSGKSWHYVIPGRNELACAMDAYPTGSLLSATLLATKYFTGIVVYPYWKMERKGKIIRGGIHVDLRTTHRVFMYRDKYDNYHNLTPSNIPTLFKLINSLDISQHR